MPKLTMFTRTPSHRGVTVSPAPRSAALPRKAMNWKKTTSEMIRMYAPPRETTMSTSTVVVNVWSRLATMTGQASWNTEVDATFADASAGAPAIRSSNRPSLFVPWRCDVSDDLHDDLPLSRLVVQFQERD